MSDQPPKVPPLMQLIEIMAALRHPETGCPWDKVQTFATIAPYTIEEAYEVADAIARGDLADLKDELGDLLLQVVYHARMAEEQGVFAFDDVADAIARKMIRRHPHVFGTPEDRAAGAADGFWARIKAEEKAEKDAARQALSVQDPRQGSHHRASRLDNVPLALPALVRAIKLQDKAASAGFDWPSLQPVFDKMREELAELEVELAKPDRAISAETSQAIEDELGDLLFVMANVSRHLKIDPEEALRRANQKFTRRFQHIEQRMAEAGTTLEASTLEDMDALWDEAKSKGL